MLGGIAWVVRHLDAPLTANGRLSTITMASMLLPKEVIMVIEDERTGTWHAYGSTAAGQPNSRFDYSSHCELAFVPSGSHSRFAGFLALHFPEVAATIDEADSGVLHLEVGALQLATRAAILQRDWPTVRTHFSFIDSVLEAADAGLHHAIGVSYLGSLFYGEMAINFAKARTLMPKRLGVALEIIERHYEEMALLRSRNVPK